VGRDSNSEPPGREACVLTSSPRRLAPWHRVFLQQSICYHMFLATCEHILKLVLQTYQGNGWNLKVSPWPCSRYSHCASRRVKKIKISTLGSNSLPTEHSKTYPVSLKRSLISFTYQIHIGSLKESQIRTVGETETCVRAYVCVQSIKTRSTSAVT